MNKKRIRGIGVGILIMSLCFPMIVGSVQDYYDINKEISLKDNQTQQILKEHPIIGYIYKAYQSKDTSQDRIEYTIRKKDEYSKEEQETLLYLQSLFTKEIQQLIDKKVVDSLLLEIDDQKAYQADYGTLVTYESEDSYRLEQILRMWGHSFKSIYYLMEPQSQKIIGISLSQENILTLSDAQLKAMAWAMIEYLELDDIDDWSYNQYGYESNKAKLRVSCAIHKRTDMYDLDIDVSLLGILNEYINQRIAIN